MISSVLKHDPGFSLENMAFKIYFLEFVIGTFQWPREGVQESNHHPHLADVKTIVQRYEWLT